MPSLRRTASSPSVRTSPYSSALTGALASRGQGQRRSSGSETATRRVLADIEWWRVTEGQCDPGPVEPELEGPNPDDAQSIVAGTIAEISFLNADSGVDHLSTPSLFWSSATPASWTESVLPTAEFAALAITPQTPPRRYLELESASSSSSLESTPEPASPALRDLHFPFLDLESSRLFEEEEECTPLVLGSLRLAPSLTRAHTFSDFGFQDDLFGCYHEASIPTTDLAPAFVY